MVKVFWSNRWTFYRMMYNVFRAVMIISRCPLPYPETDLNTFFFVKRLPEVLFRIPLPFGGNSLMSSFQIPTSLRSSPLTSRSNLYKVSPRPRFVCCTNTINFQEKLASSSSKITSKPEQKIKNDEEDDVNISGIHVPRQKYIPISKAELLDSLMLMQQEDGDGESSVNEFMILSSCLDAILHAEHKSVLEDMRNDFAQTQVRKEEEEKEETREGDNLGLSDADELAKVLSFDYELEDMLRNLLSGSSNKSLKGSSKFQSRVAVASRFQRAFVKLLKDAQFEELSVRDLKLTSALNTDYLLTLPIYVDWKKASESNAIIFRRGYATERQKGLLIVEKLDYLQSRLLQIIFFTISKPLGRVGLWINEAVKSTCQKPEVQAWVKRLKPWIKELSAFQLSDSDDESSNNLLEIHQLANSELPIWLAAQKAIPRYEGFISSSGPRGRLLRRLLTWTGLVTPIVETASELGDDDVPSEPYLRPTFLSRKSLSDIWRPASRKSCRNDLWKMLKTSFSILLSKSILQEPAFQELILLYTKDLSEGENKEDVEIPSLELKIFERIPIPDLPVIFPNKKLSFRIIDTVRLDIASILGLLAYFINYKFENISSSPSAVVLDVVAITALIIYVFRVALGYKQTWDRYQLLVNRTLYEKTLASGFGSVHFLIDASEQQQYKEAILAYAILLKTKEQFSSHTSIRDECEKFIYEAFKEKVEMPIEKAINTLERLGLVTETISGGKILIQALPRSEACNALKKRWNSLLS